MTLDASNALAWVTRIAAIGVILSSLELLAVPREFASGGLYYRRPRVPLWWVALRALAAALVLSGAFHGWIETVLLALVVLSSIAVGTRVRFGMEGSEQLLTILFAALALGGAAGPGASGAAVTRAVLWFVALQACLAYVTAGISKARTAGWSDGSYLAAILRSKLYGHPIFRRLQPSQARLLSRLVIAGECSFILALVVGKPWVLAFLVGGAVFHALNAWLMGLNIFFWAFLSTYPAIWFCSR